MNHRKNLKNPLSIVKDLWDPRQQRFWRMASTLSRESRWECALAKGKVEPPRWTLHLCGKLQAMKTLPSSPQAFIHLPRYQLTLQWCPLLIQGIILQGIQLEISWIQNFYFKIQRFQLPPLSPYQLPKMHGIMPRGRKTSSLKGLLQLWTRDTTCRSTQISSHFKKTKGKCSQSQLVGSRKIVQIFIFATFNRRRIHNFALNMPQRYISICSKLKSQVRLTQTIWADRLRSMIKCALFSLTGLSRSIRNSNFKRRPSSLQFA